MRRSSFLRIIGLLTLICFVTTLFEPSLRASDESSALLSIPSRLGTIEESFRGTSDKTVIYIQDAHDSLEAQKNIAKIIRHAVREYGVKTVFEEGFEGPVPTEEYFGFIKDPKIREKTSYFLMDKLREKDFRIYLLGENDVQYNLVFTEGLEDRIIIKGRSLAEAVKLSARHKANLEGRLSEGDAVLGNNIKSESFARALLDGIRKHELKGYFGITKSLPLGFVLEQMLPYGVCMFNAGELLETSEGKGGADKPIEFAMQKMEEFMKISKGKYPIFITLGPEGMLCGDGSQVSHISLNYEKDPKDSFNRLYRKIVSDAVKMGREGTNGAGDYTIGAITAYSLVKNWSPKEIAVEASIAAVRKITGNNVVLPPEAYDVKKL